MRVEISGGKAELVDGQPPLGPYNRTALEVLGRTLATGPEDPTPLSRTLRMRLDEAGIRRPPQSKSAQSF